MLNKITKSQTFHMISEHLSEDLQNKDQNKSQDKA